MDDPVILTISRKSECTRTHSRRLRSIEQSGFKKEWLMLFSEESIKTSSTSRQTTGSLILVPTNNNNYIANPTVIACILKIIALINIYLLHTDKLILNIRFDKLMKMTTLKSLMVVLILLVASFVSARDWQ